MSQTESVFERADRLTREGQYEMAYMLLEHAPPAQRDTEEGVTRRADLLRRLGRRDAAIDLLRHHSLPDTSQGLLRQIIEEHATFLKGLGCHGEAASVHQMLVDGDEADVQAIVNLAIDFAMADQYDEALRQFDKAIAIAPESEPAWFNKGIALLDVGRVGEAGHCFDQVISIHRSNASAWYYKAVCLMREAEMAATSWSANSKIQEARQCLGKALRIDSNLSEARELLQQISG
jgi:tetratricopeptide (TPR) repeat protein